MTLDAVQYETGLRRNHLRDLLTIFKEDVSRDRWLSNNHLSSYTCAHQLVVFLHP